METSQAIKKRFSCRQFVPSEPKDENIRKILEAGFLAPSARNLRPIDFIVVKKMDVFKVLGEINPTAKIGSTASFAIVISGDKDKNPRIEFLIEDASIACENMLLRATDLALGSLWNGLSFDTPYQIKVAEVFKFPANKIPLAILYFGRKGVEGEAKGSFDESRVYKETY